MVSLDVLAHVATATLEETSDVVAGLETDDPQPEVDYLCEGGEVSHVTVVYQWSFSICINDR